MYTLRDALIALQQLDVKPSEIVISYKLFIHLIQQAREIVREEGGEEELMEPSDDF